MKKPPRALDENIMDGLWNNAINQFIFYFFIYFSFMFLWRFDYTIYNSNRIKKYSLFLCGSFEKGIHFFLDFFCQNG